MHTTVYPLSPKQPCVPVEIPTLHVADIELPRELEPLYDLAYNFWWSWSPEARNLFASIDKDRWSLYRNPVQLLINIEPRHWYHLIEHEEFRDHYQAVIEEFDHYMTGASQSWFSRTHGHEDVGTLAYFSMEFGLHQSLAIYSGGLGVLSGDHLKSASDLGLPFVAVGLLYRHGYFQQTLDAEGVQQHFYPEYDFTRLPLRPVASRTGREVLVSVPFPGREVHAKLWLAQVGRVPLILLDTDVPENDPADRPISNTLYVRGREMRLAQELVLGMGGVKALREVGIDPSVWHLNEGHSVFMQLERIREHVAKGVALDEAQKRVKRNAVFTTHTPVTAGNEQFDPELIDKYLRSWCDTVVMPMETLQSLGRAHEGDHVFNLTALAIKMSSYANGVSALNAEVTSDMWRHLFPPEAGEQPIRPITNGVHTLSWIGPEVQRMLNRHLGAGWDETLYEEKGWDRVLDIPTKDVWAAHQAQKNRLGRFARSRLREQFARNGESPDFLRMIDKLFDPQALTIGFARRFATYKRANLIFSDIERLRALVGNSERPVQFIFAGKAHPADRPGQELIQNIFHLSRSEGFIGRVFFLENYDIRMGRMLVQGVDVWLNNPRRPLEASGTSGQKAALNGVLNCSILDGWWPEGFNGRNGWAIGTEDGFADEAAQDHHDVQSFYSTLESEIIPSYYDRDADGTPQSWSERMRDSIATLIWRFSTSRMVKDYTEDGYLPAARRFREGGSI